ncbi:hypothetical protein SAMN04488058_1334 [Deinococcus reticulitermitis]|uniref:Uncharacterized protein n=1 Tax=Deinococcus reticulitermitis TaxID=856736 RepID=A0A1H7CUY8_9DEIO|nr:hypothetical protein [Deinococcus reticulitermitis]SEJ90550.1 hypothetical protein SAMN04488058_1334 [Deinococcus reticulitermitis]
MKFWTWLTTPDPDPGFSTRKLGKLALRLFLFVLVATLLSSLLSLTPLGPYLNTWWGSLIFVLALYIPASRFLNVDTFLPRRMVEAASRPGSRPVGRAAAQVAARESAERMQRRKEKARYAGVRKGGPKFGGKRG